jgi:hypothetical protein
MGVAPARETVLQPPADEPLGLWSNPEGGPGWLYAQLSEGQGHGSSMGTYSEFQSRPTDKSGGAAETRSLPSAAPRLRAELQRGPPEPAEVHRLNRHPHYGPLPWPLHGGRGHLHEGDPGMGILPELCDGGRSLHRGEGAMCPVPDDRAGGRPGLEAGRWVPVQHPSVPKGSPHPGDPLGREPPAHPGGQWAPGIFLTFTRRETPVAKGGGELFGYPGHDRHLDGGLPRRLPALVTELHDAERELPKEAGETTSMTEQRVGKLNAHLPPTSLPKSVHSRGVRITGRFSDKTSQS